jgi:hypothetical protein
VAKIPDSDAVLKTISLDLENLLSFHAIIDFRRWLDLVSEVSPCRSHSKCDYLAPDKVVPALLGVSEFRFIKAKALLRWGRKTTGMGGSCWPNVRLFHKTANSRKKGEVPWSRKRKWS